MSSRMIVCSTIVGTEMGWELLDEQHSHDCGL